MDDNSKQIVESVVSLTEEDSNSQDFSPEHTSDAENEPSEDTEKSDLAEAAPKIKIDHPLFTKEEEESDGAKKDEKKKQQKKKAKKDTKEAKKKAWRIQATRSKVTRQSRVIPHFKKIKDPLIGLEYLVEYQDEDPQMSLKLVCNLCEVRFPNENLDQLAQHITGFKHRLAYMKKHQKVLEDPFKTDDIDNYGDLDKLKRSDQVALVQKHAKLIEQKLGRRYKELDVFVKVNMNYRQKKMMMQQQQAYGGHQPHNNVSYMGANKDYHYGGQGLYPDPYSMGGGGSLSFADIVPLLYRCEISSEDDATQALQASNYINKKILEFNTATSWNRKTQMRDQRAAHNNHNSSLYGEYGSSYNNAYGQSASANNYGMSASNAYTNFASSGQRLPPETQAIKAKLSLGRGYGGRAHVPYRH